MPTASNLVEGDILFAGDLDPTSTGLIPYLRASGVSAGDYFYGPLGLDGFGNSIINIPQVALDGKGRVIFAKVIPYTITSVQATATNFGIVRPDNTTITVSGGVISSNLSIPTATTSVFGLFRPDNSTMTINSGVVTRFTPIATSSVRGFVKPNNSTIFVNAGTIGVPEAGPGGPGIFRPDGITTKIDNSTRVVSLQESTSTKKGIHSVNSTLSLNAGVMSVPDATSSTLGKVVPDGTSVTIDANGILSTPIIYATSSTVGVAKANETNLTIGTGGEISLRKATNTTQGIVKADETTLNIVDGVISRNTATSSVLGQVRPDNTTIVSSSGVLSASLATGFSLGIARADNTTLTIASGSLIVPSASNTTLGRVSVDNTTISINTGVVSVVTATSSVLGVSRHNETLSTSAGVLSVPVATTSTLGSVKVNGNGIIISNGVISKPGIIGPATSSTFGFVRPDNTTINIPLNNATLSVPTATSSALGIVRGDQTTITNDSGILRSLALTIVDWVYFTKAQVYPFKADVNTGATTRFSGAGTLSGNNVSIVNNLTNIVDGFNSGECIGAEFILELKETSTGTPFGFNFPAVSTNYFGGFKVQGGAILPMTNGQSLTAEMVVINKGGQPFGLIYNQNII